MTNKSHKSCHLHST